MADTPQKMTLADQALVNVAFALHLTGEDDPNWKMLAACAGELRASVSVEHPFVGPLVVALDARLAEARRDLSDRGDRWRAELALAAALRRFAMWRGGLALDAHRATRGAAA